LAQVVLLKLAGVMAILVLIQVLDLQLLLRARAVVSAKQLVQLHHLAVMVVAVAAQLLALLQGAQAILQAHHHRKEITAV
jgi:hypothetical protein